MGSFLVCYAHGFSCMYMFFPQSSTTAVETGDSDGVRVSHTVCMLFYVCVHVHVFSCVSCVSRCVLIQHISFLNTLGAAISECVRSSLPWQVCQSLGRLY